MFDALFPILAQLGFAISQQPLLAPSTQVPSDLSDDVIVTGLRDLDDPKSAVTRSTLKGFRAGSGAVQSKAVFEESERYARCVLRQQNPISMALLREAIDGRINSSRQQFSQKRLGQINSTCTTSLTEARNVRGLTESTDSGRRLLSDSYNSSYYDRGAMMMELLHRFAPGLTLTRRDTTNPHVQARFNAREVSKAKFRLPADRRFLEVAICLVRTQPAYASQLIARDRSMEAIQQLEARMVNASPECTGRARRVHFDPTQFRFYIAEAVYKWTLAARDVDSLISAR